MAFSLMTIVRWLLLHWNIIESIGESDEISQTLIAGTENDFNNVNDLLQKSRHAGKDNGANSARGSG